MAQLWEITVNIRPIVTEFSGIQEITGSSQLILIVSRGILNLACVIFSHTREIPMFVPESSSKFQKFIR